MSFWRMVSRGVALSALALVLAVAAEAGPGGPRRGPGGPGMGPGRGPMLGGLELLDLSAEQETAVRELVAQQHQTLQPLHEQQRARMKKIDELADAAQPNPAQIGQLVLEAHAARKQVQAAREKLRESISALLTPEQRELWSRLESARQKAQARGRGRGAGFGPGFGLGPHAAFGGPFGPDGGPDE